MASTNQQASQVLDNRLDQLAETIVGRQWQQQPGLAARYDEGGRLKCVRDVGYNLRYLAHAVRTNEPALFIEYVAWVKVLFTRLDIPAEDLAQSLSFTRDVLREQLPASEGAAAEAILTAGLNRLPHMPSSVPSFLEGHSAWSTLAQSYLDHLLKGERHQASNLILHAVAQGAPVRDVYLHVFQPCQYEVGRLWQTNQISVAQEHFCTAATQLIMSQLYPHIFATDRIGRRLVAACVGQELHEIGLRMVADLFELEGWDTYFLGANMPAESIASSVDERDADVLALSTTMTFHLANVADVIAHVRRSCRGPQLKILVGGQPFNIAPELWRSVGADGYAIDAQAAIVAANQLLARNQ